MAVLDGLGAVTAGADEARRVRLLDPLLGTADALDDDSFDIVGLMACRDSLLIMSSAKFDNFQKIAWKFSLENCLVCYSNGPNIGQMFRSYSSVVL